MPSFSFQTNKF